MPYQVNCTRQAAIVVRSRSAGVLLSVLVRPLVDRDPRRSIKVLIEPPEKIKADHESALNIVISCPSQNVTVHEPMPTSVQRPVDRRRLGADNRLLILS